MTIALTWSVSSVESNVSNGGIVSINWHLSGTDGTNNWGLGGVTKHNPDPSLDTFIAYNDVTEANCISWAKSQINTSVIEQRVTEELQKIKTPVTNTGKPWS